MAAGDSPGERRMTNFSPEERAVIIDGLSQHGARLYGPQSGHTGQTVKARIYAEITNQVNALGVAEREPKHIRKKINDLRRMVKDKLVARKKHATGTGGGPATRIILTPEDLVVARFLDRELVEGLEGFDSGEQPLRTGKCVFSSFGCVACVWGGEVTCVKCVGPPTSECFVSSTDVQDGAGPSSAAGRPTPSMVETAPTSVLEEVEEEHVGVEEDAVYLLEETPIPGPSQTSPLMRVTPSGLSIPIRDSPSRDTIPSRDIPSRDSPSRDSPSSRPQASPAPRKASKKTRGVPEELEDNLARDQTRQTRHIGSLAGDLHRVADSLASSAKSQAACTVAVQEAITQQAGQSRLINESLQDVVGNGAALLTCLMDLQNTTSGLVSEVRSLAAAVREEGRLTRRQQRSNTTRRLRMQAATNSYLHRLAVAMEGSQAARERLGEVPPPAPPAPPAPAPPAPAPPAPARTRQLRPRSQGSRRSPRQGR